jgi:metallo-beta-lactamase class B
MIRNNQVQFWGKHLSFSLVCLFFIALFLLQYQNAHGQADEASRSRNQPIKPFRIIGNIYYVGASDVTSFLITTPQGHVLLDGGFAATVPQIKENIKALGFRIEDVKILINSHAHSDHAGGLAELKGLTKARLFASRADAALLASGGKGDPNFGDDYAYTPVRADEILRDGDTIKLGGVILTARLTPGHTKGCTTWTMKVSDGGKSYDVVFLGSISAPGYQLVDNAQYPNIVEDYERTFRLLKKLPCDVFLGSHGIFFGLREKIARLAESPKQNPFVDSEGYRNFLNQAEESFRERLKKQQQERVRGAT